MKQVFSNLAVTKKALSIALTLQAKVKHADGTGTVAVNAADVEGLKVLLYSPQVSGARDLIESGECTANNNVLTIALGELKEGAHRIVLQVAYGTQTRSIYTLELNVPSTLSSGTQEYAANVVAVSTFGDGPDVPITVDETITEESENPVTSAAIFAALADKQAAGSYADGETYKKEEGGPATIAGKVITGQYNVADTQDEYALIVGNGTDGEHLSNAFAIDKTGNLVLFNAGTPVVLTPAKLAALIA